MSLLVSLISPGNGGVIPPNSVTNAELAQMPACTLKGNDLGILGNAKDLTVTESLDLLSLNITDSPQFAGLSVGAALISPADFSVTGDSILDGDFMELHGPQDPTGFALDFQWRYGRTGTGGYDEVTTFIPRVIGESIGRLDNIAVNQFNIATQICQIVRPSQLGVSTFNNVYLAVGGESFSTFGFNGLNAAFDYLTVYTNERDGVNASVAAFHLESIASPDITNKFCSFFLNSTTPPPYADFVPDPSGRFRLLNNGWIADSYQLFEGSDLIPANYSALEGTAIDVPGTGTTLFEYAGSQGSNNHGRTMYKAGFIFALSARQELPTTAGTAELQVLVNGVAQTGVNQTIELNTTDTLSAFLIIPEADRISFVAGDHIQMQYVTTGYSPVLTDPSGVAWMTS